MHTLPGLDGNGRWDIPARLNMARQCLAQPDDAVAVIDLTGAVRRDVTDSGLRTEIVKAYVVCKDGAKLSAPELQAWVKDRLASYCYPREVEFLYALPMTVTGKVIRRDLKARAVAQ